MNKNPQLQALLKARRKNLGYQEEQTQKPQQKQQTKLQKPSNQQFLQKKKFLEANLFRQNLPKEQKLQQKPKQQIKGNSQAMKNAKALLQAKLNFGNQNSGNSASNNVSLPPPPGLPNLPPPPGLPNLPPPPGLPNLPPPPSLPNLPPPPPLNMPNLPPPPPLPKNLPPPPTLPNLPPPPNLPNLPPPPPVQNTNFNLPPPPPFNPPSQQTSNNQHILPPPLPFNPPVQKKIPQQQISQNKSAKQSQIYDSKTSSNRTSSKISQQQFRVFENKVRKQNSIDKKKSIFGNQPMLKSTNKPNINQVTSQNVNVQMKESKTNEPKPLPTPTAWTQTKQKKKIFKQKQNQLTSQFFGKDIAGFIRRQFLKTNDVLSYIDKKLPQGKTKQKVRYIFPSIFKGTRGQEGKFEFNFEPHQVFIFLSQTLYIDTKTLNVSGSFLVNNLNTFRTHNDSHCSFANKLKSYDISKDPQKLQFKAIKQLVEGVPRIEYSEPNLAKIHSCLRKCDMLIRQKSATEEFQKCSQIKEMRNQLMKATQKYCKYPQDCSTELQAIERMMARIRDIQFS